MRWGQESAQHLSGAQALPSKEAVTLDSVLSRQRSLGRGDLGGRHMGRSRPVLLAGEQNLKHQMAGRVQRWASPCYRDLVLVPVTAKGQATSSLPTCPLPQLLAQVPQQNHLGCVYGKLGVFQK